jgi:hypothetical protein
MRRDEMATKILEIRDSKGFFRVSAKDKWKEIDTIDKKALMSLLDTFLSSEVSMDAPDDKNLGNPAHQIIYKSLFAKLTALQENKSKFKDESERKYHKEIQKYSKRTPSEDGSNGHTV